MKKLNALCISLALMMAGLVLSGCIVTAEKAVFKPSSNNDIPDLSGAFRSSRSPNDVYILSRTTGTTNTFNFTAPDKSVMKLVFEPLKTAGRYAVQVENPAGPQVILGICELKAGAADLYALKPEVMALGKKYDMEISEDGMITKLPSAAKLKEFFEACFDAQYSAKVDTVTVGETKDEKKDDQKK